VVRLRPKAGDCCVFCSYGSVPCPPIQAERSGWRSPCARGSSPGAKPPSHASMGTVPDLTDFERTARTVPLLSPHRLMIETGRRPPSIPKRAPPDGIIFHIPLPRSPESIVRARTRSRIAGAASITIGIVVIHAISQERSQFSRKAKVSRKGMLATPAAIADVRPDWMTPKTKCSYFLDAQHRLVKPSA
jgi:hypothetical protein